MSTEATKPEFRSWTIPQLCAWWEENVGYEPLSNGWAESELYDLCADMWDEMNAAAQGEV